MSWKSTAAVFVAAGSLLLTGCHAVTPAEAKRGRQAQAGGVLPVTFQVPNQPTSLSPFAARGSANNMLSVIQFEPLLVGVDGRVLNRFAFVAPKDKAAGFSITVREDRWSDGQPFTSDDVVFSIKEHLKKANNSPVAGALLGIKGAQQLRDGATSELAGVQVKDQRTIEVTLERPDPGFPVSLTQVQVLPSHVYAGKDLSNPEVFREPRVGSGTYVFNSWKGSDVVFLPNKIDSNNPRKPHSRFGKVTARHVPVEGGLDALAKGDVDLAVLLPGQQVPAGSHSWYAPGNRVVSLIPLHGRLGDKRVRQAMLHAVNREEVVKQRLKGQARVVDSVMFSPEWTIGPGQPSYAADPERAKALLAEARWKQDAPLRMAVLDDTTDPAIFDDVAQQLSAVGLNIEVERRSSTDRAAVLADQSVDLIATSVVLPVRDPRFFNAVLTCDAAAMGQTSYCNPELDNKLKDAGAMTDTWERAKAYQDANLVIGDEVPVVPLWVPDVGLATSKDMKGVDPVLTPITVLPELWTPVVNPR